MTDLTRDVLIARRLGLSYGKYKAKIYDPTIVSAEIPPETKKQRYSDHQIFELWQAGMSDTEIAACVGVTRTIIQSWRDKMELPSTRKNYVDTKKYRLEFQDGITVCIKDD